MGVRGERDGGDGEADHLALAAAKTANRVAHAEEMTKVLGAKARTAELLTLAVQAEDWHAADRGD